MSSLHEAKQQLRLKIQERARSVTEGDRRRCGRNALAQLVNLSSFSTASIVGLFASDPSEISTEELFEHCIKIGKTVVFPKVAGKRLQFKQVRKWRELSDGFRGLKEPCWGKEFSASQMDLLLVPGVAFDSMGRRLGRGGGYFDRLLGNVDRPKKVVGLGYAFQLISEVPIESHDQRVDAVLTEREVVRIQGFV